MKKAHTSIFIDKYHPNREGLCAVSIRVTFDRRKRYYATGISLLEKDFLNAVYPTKRIKVEKDGKKVEEVVPRKRTDEEKKLYNKLFPFEAKAVKVIETLPVFTFDLFEKLYRQNQGASDTISYAFDEYISALKGEDRISTAMSYESAKISLNEFKEGLRFADITPTLLKSYERWMYSNKKSPTTVGIYLRSLRTIFNLSDIDRSLYPFTGKNKYKIPTGRNIKKALTIEEIGKIYNAKLDPGSVDEMGRDYWIFIYLCNGMNVKDMCRLRYRNIDGDFIKFERAKTQRTKQEIEEIRISLKKDAREIINRWGQKSVDPDTYIFPHLTHGISAKKERQVVQQLTKLINGRIDGIAKNNDITAMKVTTYTARHSFATVLKRSGASTEFIGEALGHSDLKTTKNYLASFEDDTVEKVTEALTAFKS